MILSFVWCIIFHVKQRARDDANSDKLITPYHTHTDTLKLCKQMSAHVVFRASYVRGKRMHNDNVKNRK